MKNKNTIIASILGTMGLLSIISFVIYNIISKPIYKVTFDTDGGSSIISVDVKSGDKVEKPINPTKEGYEFQSWIYNNMDYDFNLVVKENITLKAKWKEIEKKNITFTVGNITKTVSALSFSEIDVNTLGFENKAGYVIKWYLNGKEYNDDSILTENITLEGKYVKTNTFTIKFNSDGGTVVEKQNIKEGMKVEVPKNVTKLGYILEGWYLNNKKYNFDTEVYNDFTLIAKWIEDPNIKRYKVSYNTDGGSKIKEEIVIENKTATRPTNPIKNNFIFIDWYYNDKVFDFKTKIKEDIELKAKWRELKKYTITFKYDDDSEYQKQEVLEGETVDIPENPKKNGSIFVEWQLNGKAYDFKKIVTNDITLKAVFSSKDDIVIVNFNTGVGGSVVYPQIVKKGSFITAIPSNPIRNGCTFVEWQLNGNKYDFTKPVTENITLVAFWKINKYTVMFDSNGGSEVMNQILYYGNIVEKPADPVKDGWTFKEWKLDGKAYDFTKPVTENITLVADYINNDSIAIFSDGTINNKYFNIIEFGGTETGKTNSDGINSAISYAKKNNIKNIKLKKAKYYIETVNEVTIKNDKNGKGFSAINMKSNVNLDLGGSELQIVTNSYPRYIIVAFIDVNNSSIYNGKIIGDRTTHTCSYGELIEKEKRCSRSGYPDNGLSHGWGMGIQLKDANNITIDKLTITETTGDGICMSSVKNINIKNSDIYYVRRNGISVITGEKINIIGNSIHAIIGQSPQAGIDIENDNFTQSYSDIDIKNNKIYNTVGLSISVYNKIYNLNISNNELFKKTFARVTPRTKLDAANIDLFPTDKDEEYLRNHYNIKVENNKVLSKDYKKEERDRYQMNITDDNLATVDNINSLNYKSYYNVSRIEISGMTKENGEYRKSLKVKDSWTIPVVFGPTSPTYKILSYEIISSNPVETGKDVITLSNNKVTAKNAGEAIVKITATDYGVSSQSSDDDKYFIIQVRITVSK